MKSPKRSRNPKRRLHPSPSPKRLQELVDQVQYGGHPHHKRSPGDFGLTPPAAPRPNKSLCDGVKIFQRGIAHGLLQEGLSRGLVSRDADDNFPRHIWAVTQEGHVLEARCDDFTNGRYHGYPLEPQDPMANLVSERWNEQE